MTNLYQVKALQERIGTKTDGDFGPKSTQALIEAFTNISAPAINKHDYIAAASRLGVPVANIRAAFFKESASGGYSSDGLVKILNEGQWFSRLTRRAFDSVIPTLSYPRWTRRFYARTMRARYVKLAKKCRFDVEAAFASCSWGGPQVMGFHAKDLGYDSAVDMAFSLVDNEQSHLDLFIRFIERNNLQDELAQCKPNDKNSCIPYSRRYNGSGFASHNYHGRLAKLIAKFS